MFRVLALAVAVAATTGVAGAQATGTYKSTVKPASKTSTAKHRTMRKAESQAALQREAKIPEATARATALAQVPNGTVKSSELEREKGKLIYSYDISVPGKTGIEEIAVNAIDGSVVSHEHETPKMEKKEAAKEAKKKKAK
ncbi:MAG: PepSY domain-containing protein [Gemmatimonadota bacterium]|nr:PepSY domain-containing protein [Gemmatimonadota bacterium]